MEASTPARLSARHLWLSILAGVLALAALAVALAPAPVEAQTPTPTPTATPEAPSIPLTLETAVRAAVAQEATVDPSAVTVDRAAQVVWENGCLGIQPTQDTACTQQIVSGFVVWASTDSATYRVHTDYSGADVRIAASDVADAAADPIPSGATLFQSNADTLPESLATQVRTVAAARAGTVTAEQVEVLRVEDVTFTDSCLGLGGPAESCLQAITDGYVVWVAAGDHVYRYHTSDEAANVRFAEGDLALANIPVYELPEGVTAAGEDNGSTDGLVVGEIPTSGFGLLQVSAAATPSQLLTGLVAQGCAPVSISITEAGEFVVYVPGAPDFVNEAFPASLAANTGFIVRCA